ncbi:hypothetical protein Z043_119326, partial [Scleropages formosus]
MVELHVKKPLMPIHLSKKQVRLEMLCLCSQLDLLIRAQVSSVMLRDGGCVGGLISFLLLSSVNSCSANSSFKSSSNKIAAPWSRTLSAEKAAAEVMEKMILCLEHLPEPVPQLEDYLDAVGLSTMFPRVEVFIIHGSPVDMLEKPVMDDYFPHIGKLNQLLVLSQQLEDDVQHLGSHKYIAHQLSVIYHVLSSFKGILPLSVLKRDIEANFKNLKMALVTEEGSKQEPQLPAHYAN